MSRIFSVIPEVLLSSNGNVTVTFQDIISGIFFAGLISLISYKVKFLTLSGTIATFILAGFIFSLGGIKWSVPILTFFILSSILSKMRKKKNEEVEVYFEKSGVRDYQQVIANGGLGGVLVVLNLFYPNEIFYLIYLAILSSVCADTWATEIGTWKKTNTYNVLNLAKVEQGVSGGISVRGLIGSIAGAVVIAISGIFWIEYSHVQYIILLVSAGLFGSLFDSFLGATVQAQNKCTVCRKVTEKSFHCANQTEFYKGFKWINNDMVNLFCGIAGAVIMLLIINLF